MASKQFEVTLTAREIEHMGLGLVGTAKDKPEDLAIHLRFHEDGGWILSWDNAEGQWRVSGCCKPKLDA